MAAIISATTALNVIPILSQWLVKRVSGGKDLCHELVLVKQSSTSVLDDVFSAAYDSSQNMQYCEIEGTYLCIFMHAIHFTL